VYFVLIGNLFASSCYTAVNGYSAVGTLSTKLADEFSSTSDKISDLSDATNKRLEKMQRIALLQEQIRKMEAQNYIKSKQILHNLKTRNEELGISASLKAGE
jgi:stress response protein YsnF